MQADWLKDGRKIPDDVMNYVRQMAVHAVRDEGESPEVVARVFQFHRSCIYRWLKQYDEGGEDALITRTPPGATPVVTSEMDEWLKMVVLGSTPLQFGYDTNLWNCKVLVDLLRRKFDVKVSDDTVRLHLEAMGLTPQKPQYQDHERNAVEVEHFKREKFPQIQKLAEKMGADIAFEDESGVGVDTRHGSTWGLKGKTPVVRVCMQRGGYNVLSIVTAQGQMSYSVQDGTINGERFVEFLGKLLEGRARPLILLVDHASFHKSKPVRDFVRAHRKQLRIFFLPKRAPDVNPDEQLWNEIKNNHLGKQAIKNKADLKVRLVAALDKVQNNIERVVGFFHLPNTRYAMGNVA